MTPSARLQAAIELLEAIDAAGKPADSIGHAWFRARRYMGAKDRRAVAERAWGILRRRARLDWWLERAGHEARGARARILADLALSDGLTPEQAAKLCDGFTHAPAPLTAAERRMMGALHGHALFHHDMPAWVRGEYPDWLDPALRALFGEALAAETGAMRDEAPVHLRVNRLKASREQAIAALAAEGIEASPTALSPLGLVLGGRVPLGAQQAFRDGLVEIQDEGSQLVALLSDARPGQAVADYCAGAGGKTLALAAQMENRGRLVALDIHEYRVDRAKERLRRAGAHNVTRHVLGVAGDKWAKRHAHSFDRVLADAPCSGSGTWRRNPDAKWRLTPGDLDELTRLQADILDRAARLVKPGGRLIYATCSLLGAENEDQVAAFLSRHPDYTVVPVPPVWAETVGGNCPVDGPFLRLTPLRHGTDGFFAAILERAP